MYIYIYIYIYKVRTPNMHNLSLWGISLGIPAENGI